MHYANADKRLDEWVPETIVRPSPQSHTDSHTTLPTEPSNSSASHSNGHAPKKRKRSLSVEVLEGADGTEGSASAVVKMSEEEYDIEHHKQITAKRNFDKVNFGKWQIKTWYVGFIPV